MSDPILSNIFTWVAANGSSIGGILLWIAKPLNEKIAAFEKKLEAMEKRLAPLEGLLGDPRSSVSPDFMSPAEVQRRLSSLEKWQEKELDESRQALRRDIEDFKVRMRELQQQLNHLVSDEEFRGFSGLVNTKMEKIAETVGVIKGRLTAAAARPAHFDTE